MFSNLSVSARDSGEYFIRSASEIQCMSNMLPLGSL